MKKLDSDTSPYSAIILAYAGLHRLGWGNRVTEILEPRTPSKGSHIPSSMYAVGQGAIAVECRADDQFVLDLLKPLNDGETQLRVEVERGLMRYLEGGCSIPIGVCCQRLDSEGIAVADSYDDATAICTTITPGRLRLRAVVCSVDGTQVIEAGSEMDIGQDCKGAQELGIQVGKILLQKGAGPIFDAVKAMK
jgi:hydroxymethylbilane synthase